MESNRLLKKYKTIIGTWDRKETYMIRDKFNVKNGHVQNIFLTGGFDQYPFSPETLLIILLTLAKLLPNCSVVTCFDLWVKPGSLNRLPKGHLKEIADNYINRNSKSFHVVYPLLDNLGNWGLVYCKIETEGKEKTAIIHVLVFDFENYNSRSVSLLSEALQDLSIEHSIMHSFRIGHDVSLIAQFRSLVENSFFDQNAPEILLLDILPIVAAKDESLSQVIYVSDSEEGEREKIDVGINTEETIGIAGKKKCRQNKKRKKRLNMQSRERRKLRDERQEAEIEKMKDEMYENLERLFGRFRVTSD